MPDPQTAPPCPASQMHSFSAELAAGAKALTKGARTRNAIRIALCDCLETITLDALTIRDICARAGVSHGTFYIYFANRNALVSDVLMRFSAFVQARMRRASQAQPQAPARAATSAYMELFVHNRGLMKCLLRHLEGFPEAQRAFQDLNREWLESVVAARAGQLRQSGQPVDRDELMRRAYALGGMVDQYLAGLWLDQDPHMQAFSHDQGAILDTLDLLWQRGMAP